MEKGWWIIFDLSESADKSKSLSPAGQPSAKSHGKGGILLFQGEVVSRSAKRDRFTTEIERVRIRLFHRRGQRALRREHDACSAKAFVKV